MTTNKDSKTYNVETLIALVNQLQEENKNLKFAFSHEMQMMKDENSELREQLAQCSHGRVKREVDVEESNVEEEESKAVLVQLDIKNSDNECSISTKTNIELHEKVSCHDIN